MVQLQQKADTRALFNLQTYQGNTLRSAGSFDSFESWSRKRCPILSSGKENRFCRCKNIPDKQGDERKISSPFNPGFIRYSFLFTKQLRAAVTLFMVFENVAQSTAALFMITGTWKNPLSPFSSSFLFPVFIEC